MLKQREHIHRQLLRGMQILSMLLWYLRQSEGDRMKRPVSVYVVLHMHGLVKFQRRYLYWVLTVRNGVILVLQWALCNLLANLW